MNLEELFKDRSKEEISAFAFSTGKMIEETIKVQSEGAKRDMQELLAKVLAFHVNLKVYYKEFTAAQILELYDKHFEIIKHTKRRL